MIRRPKPGEGEEDILQMQEEFLREKGKNQNYQPAAQVVNLRPTEPKHQTSTSKGIRKPSKYAQSKGLKKYSENVIKSQSSTGSIMGDVLEKNLEETPKESKPEIEDDKVYYPKVLPSLLGKIIEKNLDQIVDLSVPMPSEGFPVATKRDLSTRPGKKSIETQSAKKMKQMSSDMEVDEPSSSQPTTKDNTKPVNLPDKSYLVSSKDAADIHNDNVKILSKMTEKEILEEQQKLLSSLDPKLVAFIKARRQEKFEKDVEKMDTAEPTSTLLPTQKEYTVDPVQNDSLWENDVLSHPNVDKWLHCDSLEKDKLEWMKGIEESKKVKADEPYEARFNFKGYLLPYSMEYNEENKTLFHHGDEPDRPGYSLTELIELSRSTITQQRVMALNTIAGVLEYYNAGIYKDIIEIPLSKIFFIIRIAMDENKVIILEPAMKAMRNLLFNRIDEASLDALIGFEESFIQPCLENDKSEIAELESQASEFNDFHLAEIDIITALLRTDILQRLYYILETVRPSFNCVQYSMQILTRLARDSVETAKKMVEMNHLMETIMKNFIPTTSINFAFRPEIVYNGKPVLSAVKLLRVLSLQSEEISKLLASKYDIFKPIAEYISSGVDGTYGLRIQIEAFCILSNLVHYGVGTYNATILCPIIETTVYKHVQGTDIYINSSVISATHAAVVLQSVSKLLGDRSIYLDRFQNSIYSLLEQGISKWLAQLSQSQSYTCAHLRLICAALDCCRTILLRTINYPTEFLNSSFKTFLTSRGYEEVLKNLILSSNLLSGIENKDLHFTPNLMTLGSSVVESAQKVLPVLTMTSPVSFLASLSSVLKYANEEVTGIFLESLYTYMNKLASTIPSLTENWFTRVESDLVFHIVYLADQCGVAEAKNDLVYAVASKLCYILRIDKKIEVNYLFDKILFNKSWFTADRLMNLVSLSDADEFSKASAENIKQCYQKVINLNYEDSGPNVVLRKWQEPILPRDWIYLPILSLYSTSQETASAPKVVGEHAKKVAALIAAEKEMIISCSLEWILFNELCFPDLLNDIDKTDKFCRIMCVFLCDNSLFLEPKIKSLLQKCTQMLFKKKSAFNFDKQLVGLNNFQDFYTQFLEQFQSVSYGDHIFAACVLVPLAQKHNVKWRKVLWSEYAGCLRALDCPEDLLCYSMQEYLYPKETDESLIKSYVQALSSNLLRPNTIAYRIAEHHVGAFKNRTNK